MRVVTTFCDHCRKQLDERYIMLGSENGGELCFVNKTKDASIKSLQRYKDLHFCSNEHMIEYFFKPKS